MIWPKEWSGSLRKETSEWTLEILRRQNGEDFLADEVAGVLSKQETGVRFMTLIQVKKG